MTEEDSEDETTISLEYTPMELVAFLQLLDHVDLEMLKEGMPMRVIGVQRRKILEALMKDDIYSNIEDEKEKMEEKFIEEMGGDIDLDSGNSGSAFQ